MNDLPRQKLCELIATYGRPLCDEPWRCEALLRDFCGENKREINVLVSALRERVATDLLTSQNETPREIIIARLAKRLHDNLGLAEDISTWAVESWALALGVMSIVQRGSSNKRDGAPSRISSTETKRRSIKKKKSIAEQQAPGTNERLANPRTGRKPSDIPIINTRASDPQRVNVEQRADQTTGKSSGDLTAPLSSSKTAKRWAVLVAVIGAFLLWVWHVNQPKSQFAGSPPKSVSIPEASPVSNEGRYTPPAPVLGPNSSTPAPTRIGPYTSNPPDTKR